MPGGPSVCTKTLHPTYDHQTKYSYPSNYRIYPIFLLQEQGLALIQSSSATEILHIEGEKYLKPTYAVNQTIENTCKLLGSLLSTTMLSTYSNQTAFYLSKYQYHCSHMMLGLFHLSSQQQSCRDRAKLEIFVNITSHGELE